MLYYYFISKNSRNSLLIISVYRYRLLVRVNNFEIILNIIYFIFSINFRIFFALNKIPAFKDRRKRF